MLIRLAIGATGPIRWRSPSHRRMIFGDIFDEACAHASIYIDVVGAVARTESFYIANEGSKEAYRQSGVVKTVRWYTAEDEGVCPYCGPMHGRVIGVSETFFERGEEAQEEGVSPLTLDYRAIDVPPLHTNCRCFIRPEQIEVAG